MYVVTLRQSGSHPLPHRSLAAHACPRVPKSRAVLATGFALGRDDVAYLLERLQRTTTVSIVSIRRTHHQDRCRGRKLPQTSEQCRKHAFVAVVVPTRRAGLVGAVGEDDQCRI